VDIPGKSKLIEWHDKHKQLMDEIVIREDDDYDVILKRKANKKDISR
jgi:hypothetical protein